jgi:hypothetical protein
MTKSIDKPIDRFKVLVKGKDKAGEYRRVLLECSLTFLTEFRNIR